MSNDSKLQKVTLGPDWIELAFGEPKVVAEALFKQLNLFGTPFKMPTVNDLKTYEYQPAAGNLELTAFLEKKYDAKVVVCNGAKQALFASLCAIAKRDGLSTIYYDTPFYPANPGFVQAAGLSWATSELADSRLITSPNNPDGRNYTNAQMIEFQTTKPMI